MTHNMFGRMMWSLVIACNKESVRGGRIAEISAHSFQCCVWPTWLARARSVNHSTESSGLKFGLLFLLSRSPWYDATATGQHAVPESGDLNLSGERVREETWHTHRPARCCVPFIVDFSLILCTRDLINRNGTDSGFRVWLSGLVDDSTNNMADRTPTLVCTHPWALKWP